MDIKEKLGRLVIAFASSSVYLPVIAGIITPMIWVLAAWYSAWYVVGLIFPFSELWTGLWIPIKDMSLAISIWAIEFCVFCVGIGYFIWALKELTSKRALEKKNFLVTTGPYQLVRHPQHLGIAIALLPIALFNISYAPHWTGLRPGDIFAWSLVTFLLIVVSDIEEAGLLARFKDEYEKYCKRTPFFLPWKIPFGIKIEVEWLEKGKPARYIVGFILYWCIMVIVLIPFTLVKLVWAL
jgi:protein-S-isoprenylcysteine O-methyltransferase Ste14